MHCNASCLRTVTLASGPLAQQVLYYVYRFQAVLPDYKWDVAKVCVPYCKIPFATSSKFPRAMIEIAAGAFSLQLLNLSTRSQQALEKMFSHHRLSAKLKTALLK